MEIGVLTSVLMDEVLGDLVFEGFWAVSLGRRLLAWGESE